METYNNIFCISSKDITCGDPHSDSVKERPVMNYDTLHKYYMRAGKLNPKLVVRKGRGLNSPVLLNHDLLRDDIKRGLFEKYGDVKRFAGTNRLQELIEPDFQASSFFSKFRFDDDSEIKSERQVEYNANAMILNAAGRFYAEAKGKIRSRSGVTSGIWNAISNSINSLDTNRYPHSLPSHPSRLQEKFGKYMENGYLHFIHKGNRNANAKKTTDAVERLIISLYCQQNLPFGTWVYDNYMQFLSGSLTIVDVQTGLMYDRDDFFNDEKGTYITISKSTVSNIINNPVNAVIIDRFRNSRIDHITKVTPFNHRRPPTYSLSKISVDDRTFSRKLSDGTWLNAYVAFDVLSQVQLSCAYSIKRPTLPMVFECFREMYRTINENNLVWPGEMECEQFLMKEIKPELEAMFHVVTLCAAGNSKEKRAEHLIRGKKYSDEKAHQIGIGRWYGKGVYKTKSNNKDDDYKQPRLPLETLIGDDKESIKRYNNALHPNQKMFPGKTRWQVLVENMNPDLGRPQKHKLFRFLGMRTETSIRNNDFASVQYEKYAIDNQGAIDRLKPHNYSVEAFYVPELDGTIGEVYLYQGDTFITRATKIERYNEAKIERTDRDEEIRLGQAKRQAHFYKVENDLIKQKVTRKLEIFQTEPKVYENLVPEIVQIPEPEPRGGNAEVDQWIDEYRQADYREIGIDIA